MVQVLGAIVVAFLVFLVVGGITGRVKIKSCCAVADPRRDARMRAAFADDPDVTVRGAGADGAADCSGDD